MGWMKTSRMTQFITFFAQGWTLAFWVTCIAVPLGTVLFMGATQQGWSLLFDPTVLAVVRITLWQALWSALISGGVGIFLGLWVGSFLTKSSSSSISSLLIVPYGVPTVVCATAWVSWLGRSGILSQFGLHTGWAYSIKAVILAHVFLNIPLVAFLVSQSRKDIPNELLEAAQTLGASRWHEFRWVIWPHIRWVFLGACAQVVNLCTMSFVLVLILGGGPPVQSLETEIYQRLRYGSLDMTGAVACALWELVLTLVPWIFYLFFKDRSLAQELTSQESVHRKVSGRQKFKLQGRVLWLGCFFLILPYFAVLNRQTFAGLMRLGIDSEWRGEIFEPLRISAILAASTSLAAVFTAAAAVVSLSSRSGSKSSRSLATSLKKSKNNSWSSWGVILLSLPSGISVLVLSLGVWMAYGKWIDPFEGSLVAMILLQMTLFFPLAFRILWPLAQVKQTRQLESAALLGATPFQAFWNVEWPRWRVPLLAALSGVAGASLGEVGAVSLFYSEKLIPLPLLISRWMEQYRFADAQTVCGLLFLLSFLLIVVSLETGKRILRC